jgi:4-hydroxy-tetrahydrodipicolinate synthase
MQNRREDFTGMAQKQVQGIYAALLTPRLADSGLDLSGMSRLVEFLAKNDVRSYALNGATGEFCLTSPKELRALFGTIREVLGDEANVLCGVGAAGTAEAIELARIAQEEGSRALLAPAPYFFSYQQDDLEAFFQTLAATVQLPVLLYNLPQFTTGLEVEAACRLIRDVPNIIGIKDSSGSLDILRALTQQAIPACRIIGNDGALVAALKEGICDGVVSGVACVLPELIQSVYNATDGQGSAQFRLAVGLLDEFIAQIDIFPTPWGLKWIAEARGILHASFAQPVSSRRTTQSADLMDWFQGWQASLPVNLAAK